MRRLRSAAQVCIGLVVLAVWLEAAPARHGAPDDLSRPLGVDPALATGTFPNGLRYYVRRNRRPEKRAELRLVVRAGSALEDDTQQGFAHFVEHMAFSGTAHFPKQAIVSFVESLGMRFGADLNAGTSFNETIYKLDVPTDDEGVLARALLVLEDWAGGVTFDEPEVERERGVITEEWRLGRGAAARLRDQQFPVLFKGSRYADRIPIGRMETVQHATAAGLRKFYTDWYRPDLMAVVAVGDFDPAVVTHLVETRFAHLPRAATPRPRPTFDVLAHDGTVYAVTTDRETTASTVSIRTFLPLRETSTIGAYRGRIVDRVTAEMLAARLAEIAQKPDAPFIRAVAGGRGIALSRTREEAVLGAAVKDDRIAETLQTLLAEVERTRRFGFTTSEVERERQIILASYERALADEPSRSHVSRADEYIRNFLERESLPTIGEEYALNKRFLPEITAAEATRTLAEWFPDRNRFVFVTAPAGTGHTVPTEAALAAAVRAARASRLDAYVDSEAGAGPASGGSALVGSLPSPGTVARTREVAGPGLTEWELGNGVRVVLKPTSSGEGEVVFRASAPGGTSLASDADYIPASVAAQVVAAGGLGRFSVIDLRKMLAGRTAAVHPFIAEIEQGMTGNCSRKDLETLFQLIYLAFTQPRADAAAFSVQAAQARSNLANRAASPEYAMLEALTSALGRNHPRRRLPTAATVDQWNLERSFAFYKERFADASGFTFVFTGAFDEALMKPLVERYLATLPAAGRREQWRDVGAQLPEGVIEKRVEKGIEPKSAVSIVFKGPFVSDPGHRAALAVMADVLETRLLKTIRGELGGTYTIAVNHTSQKFPRPEYTLSISFGCDPARADALVARVFQEIDRLRDDGPTDTQLADVKAAFQRDFETRIQQLNFLAGQILSAYESGEDPASLWDRPEQYRRLDAAAIRDAARTYLDTGNYVKVVLVPERAPAAVGGASR